MHFHLKSIRSTQLSAPPHHSKMRALYHVGSIVTFRHVIQRDSAVCSVRQRLFHCCNSFLRRRHRLSFTEDSKPQWVDAATVLCLRCGRWDSPWQLMTKSRRDRFAEDAVRCQVTPGRWTFRSAMVRSVVSHPRIVADAAFPTVAAAAATAAIVVLRPSYATSLLAAHKKYWPTVVLDELATYFLRKETPIYTQHRYLKVRLISCVSNYSHRTSICGWSTENPSTVPNMVQLMLLLLLFCNRIKLFETPNVLVNTCFSKSYHFLRIAASLHNMVVTYKLFT